MRVAALSPVKYFLVLLVAGVLAWLAATACLFSQEDYTPERGSPIYYLGISSLIRDMPLVEVIDQPHYFGSVGDGNKPPQSEVSYNTRSTDKAAIRDPIERYLNQHDFWQQSPENSASNDLPDHTRVVQTQEYRSPSGELVVVTLIQIAGFTPYKVRISHFM